MSSPSADLVLHNANILTLDPRLPRAELVAIGAGKIIRIGSHDDLELFKGGSRIVDCEGKTVVPGFNDAHAHILAYASLLLGIDCSPASVASIPEIQDRIRREAENIPRGTWLRADGYNEFYLAERRHPTRHDLDIASPYHPVKLTHRSMHACVLNSVALSLVGISIETPEPPGGLIDRELDTGEPSGLLFGMNACLDERVIPPLSKERFREGVKCASREFLSRGVTSIQDATVNNGLKHWQSFRRFIDNGELIPRVSMMLGFRSLDKFRDKGMNYGNGDERLKLGAVKLTLDEVGGRLNPTQEELNDSVLRAHKAGF